MEIKNLARRAKAEWLGAASVYGPRLIGSNLHSFLSRSYSDEQRAVESGKLIHYRGERRSSSQMLLRRSVHRIEKALVSEPRRTTFAADYIGKTVATFKALSALSSRDSGELKWCQDVLTDYFQATEKSADSRIVKARGEWERLVLETADSEDKLSPFAFVPLEENGDSFQNFSVLAHHRRSVRRFQPRVVPRELVLEAAEVGLTAPSACNRQSLRLIVVDDPARVSTLASIPMGTAGFADQIPTLAVLVGQHRGYEHHRDRHAIYVDGGLFSTGFILALEALGLNTCCINWPEIPKKNEQISGLLGLESDERVVMLIAIGYGASPQLVPRSHKRSVKGVVGWQ